MTTRRKYARTIADAFESLTLDGRTLTRMEVYTHFDKLRKKRLKAEV